MGIHYLIKHTMSPVGRVLYVFVPAVVFVALAACVSAAVSGAADTLDIDGFIAEAGISCSRTFVLETTVERWNWMLDNPVAMGILWNRYGFEPAYRVIRADEGFTVIDPTGLRGELREVPATGGERIFHGAGYMKNWFVPVSLTGTALIIAEHKEMPQGVAVGLSVYGEGGDDRITRVLLKLISPVLTRFIGRRIDSNVKDLATIVDDMEHDPGKIRRYLFGVAVKGEMPFAGE